MNVLHLDEQRGWRGGEQQASYLVQGMASRGHQIFIAGRRRGEFLHTTHGGVPVVRVSAPFAGEWDLYTAWKLARLVRREQIDIIHAHTSHTHGVACLVRCLAGKGVVVVSRRVDFPPKDNGFNRIKYDCPHGYIAISGRIAEVLREAGIPSDKVHLVRSSIDPERFDVGAIERRELGVPEGVPLLGNVAALVGHKDHATLLDAMPLVLRDLPDLHLVIAGDGPLRTVLTEQIARLELTEHVHLLGYRKDVPRILRALDGFVLSSKEEGLGTSVLDAMACGVPVVATAGGGIPETVRHGETGLLAPVGDPEQLAACIVEMFRDRQRATTMATRARDMVAREFNVDAMVEKNLAVYERLLQKDGPVC